MSRCRLIQLIVLCSPPLSRCRLFDCFFCLIFFCLIYVIVFCFLPLFLPLVRINCFILFKFCCLIYLTVFVSFSLLSLRLPFPREIKKQPRRPSPLGAKTSPNNHDPNNQETMPPPRQQQLLRRPRSKGGGRRNWKASPRVGTKSRRSMGSTG